MPGPSRGPRAGPNKPAMSAAPASDALAMMVEALALIDKSGGADIAGAHLDLAIHRLREWIEREDD